MIAGHVERQQHARRHVEAAAATAAGPRATRRVLRQPHRLEETRKTYSSIERQVEVIQGLTAWAASELPRFIKPSEFCWQPSDLLPDPSSETFFQQLSALHEEATKLPNDVLVVLAGLVVVLATNPNQQSVWCATPVLAPESGADEQPWALWRRCCSADCNRHRQLLLQYCYCCGAVDCRALDITMQHAIGAGSSSSRPDNIYQQLITSTLQARMSRVMFSNLSSVAAYHGAAVLSKMAAAIAADEARQELAQVSAVTRIFQQDPQGSILALAEVVKRGVVSPGCRMDDGWHTQQGNHNRLSNCIQGAGTFNVQIPSDRSSPLAGRAAVAAAVGAETDDTADPEIDLSLGQPEIGHIPAAQETKNSRDPRGGDGVEVSAGGQCSQLYVDFMAAADAVRVFTVSDTAAAVEQCCKLWKVAEVRPSTEVVAAAQGYLLSYDSHLRRLAEIQLEGRLRARRRDKLRTANFSWVGKREVVLG